MGEAGTETPEDIAERMNDEISIYRKIFVDAGGDYDRVSANLGQLPERSRLPGQPHRRGRGHSADPLARHFAYRYAVCRYGRGTELPAQDSVYVRHDV